MSRFLFEIEERHRRPKSPRDRNEYHAIVSAIGRILPGDVGKRVYLTGAADVRGTHVGGVIQVENDTQRDARKAKG